MKRTRYGVPALDFNEQDADRLLSEIDGPQQRAGLGVVALSDRIRSRRDQTVLSLRKTQPAHTPDVGPRQRAQRHRHRASVPPEIRAPIITHLKATRGHRLTNSQNQP